MTLSLVADNPYRVFGVGTQAKNTTLTANYKSMMTELLKGGEIDLGQDMTSFIKPPLRTPRRLDLAKSQLMSARGRCFYALFWFVDSNRLDHAALYYLAQGQREKAVKILQSQHSFSSYINLAVLALMEDRFDDAATLYSRCLQDEQLTQDFVQCIIGDQFKIKGAFVLSKVLEVLSRAKDRYERDEQSDERSYAGAGYGVRNKEAQSKKVRLVPEMPHTNLVETLQLKKQANSFDRHLNDALNNLIENITAINREHGMEGDFVEVELNPNPAAQMVLDELTRFLSVNSGLMDSFREHCFQVRERSMYLDYVYNLVSITHYVFHLYATEFGRQYSNALVQQMRSIVFKLERAYFRLKSDDIDYFIASLRRVEDSLPYYNAVSANFEKHYLLSDDEHLIGNFYAFYNACSKIIDDFNRNFGLRGNYIDCMMHLQDMIVRYNVSFMLVLVNLALRHPQRSQAQAAPILTDKDLVVDESKMQSFAMVEANGDGATGAAVAAGVGAASGNAKQQKYQAEVAAAVSKAERAHQKEILKAQRKKQEKQDRLVAQIEKRRSAFFKRKLAHEKTKFKLILDRFETFSISPNSATLIDVTMRQVDRLPPPVSAKNILWGIGLIIAAVAAIYLNSYLNSGGGAN